MGGSLTSVVQNNLTKGCTSISMLSPNTNMIAVSFACPKNPKKPYRMGPLRVISVGNLLEKLGDLRDIAISGPIKLWHF